MKKNTVEISKRLNVIAGQIKGIARMVEEGREFPDIVVQLSSIKAAIEKIEDLILNNELESDKKSMELFKLFKKKYLKQQAKQ